jgi:hypothetical protein
MRSYLNFYADWYHDYIIIIRSFDMIACNLTMSLVAIADATLTRGVTIGKTGKTA